MQQVTTKTGGRLIFDQDDWANGLGNGGKFVTTPTFNKATGKGFQYATAVDPFSFYGSVAPGYLPSANATNNSGLAGTLVAFKTQDSTYSYGIDSGGKLHSIDYSGNTGVINASPHTITGTSPVGQDIVLYKRRATSTTYTTSLFYSYYNNTNWDIGCITDATVSWASATFDDDFMSTVPTVVLDASSASPADGKGVEQRTMPHPMCVGADDILYIGSGRYLHAYDGDTGSQGTFTSRVLTLPAGTQIVALEKFNDLLLIAVNYYSTSSSTGVGQALLYTWNYIDADTSSVIPLEDNYVSALFLWGGAPTVVTNGVIERNGNVKVKIVSGNAVLKVADFDGTPPINRGVVPTNRVLYMNCGGKIISIGNPYKETQTKEVNHLGTLLTPTVSGGLFYDAVTTSHLILWGGTSASTTYTFTNLSNNNGHGAGQFRTFSYFPVFPQGKIGKITNFYVQYAKTLASGGTNGTLTITLYPDNGTAYTVFNAVSSVTGNLTKRASNALTDVNFPQFNSLELFLSWATGSGGSSPIVSQIIVDYDLVDIS